MLRWSTRDDQLRDRELALKSWSVFAVAYMPLCSDRARVPRDAIVRCSRDVRAPKSLRLPVFGPQLGIAAAVAGKVCVARTLKSYLTRTSHCSHQNRVWCSTVARNGISHNGGRRRVWMREP